MRTLVSAAQIDTPGTFMNTLKRQDCNALNRSASVVSIDSRTTTYQSDSIVCRLRRMRKALSVPELAEMLNMGRNTVYSQIKSGRIPSYRIGQTVRLDPAVIADWLEAQEMAA
jgi:excisionase family DNA binding protein